LLSYAAKTSKEAHVKLFRLFLLALIPALALTLAGCGDNTGGMDASVDMSGTD
jgi:hypothetical protein